MPQEKKSKRLLFLQLCASLHSLVMADENVFSRGSKFELSFSDDDIGVEINWFQLILFSTPGEVTLEGLNAIREAAIHFLDDKFSHIYDNYALGNLNLTVQGSNRIVQQLGRQPERALRHGRRQKQNVMLNGTRIDFSGFMTFDSQPAQFLSQIEEDVLKFINNESDNSALIEEIVDSKLQDLIDVSSLYASIYKPFVSSSTPSNQPSSSPSQFAIPTLQQLSSNSDTLMTEPMGPITTNDPTKLSRNDPTNIIITSILLSAAFIGAVGIFTFRRRDKSQKKIDTYIVGHLSPSIERENPCLELSSSASSDDSWLKNLPSSPSLSTRASRFSQSHHGNDGGCTPPPQPQYVHASVSATEVVGAMAWNTQRCSTLDNGAIAKSAHSVILKSVPKGILKQNKSLTPKLDSNLGIQTSRPAADSPSLTPLTTANAVSSFLKISDDEEKIPYTDQDMPDDYQWNKIEEYIDNRGGAVAEKDLEEDDYASKVIKMASMTPDENDNEFNMTLMSTDNSDNQSPAPPGLEKFFMDTKELVSVGSPVIDDINTAESKESYVMSPEKELVSVGSPLIDDINTAESKESYVMSPEEFQEDWEEDLPYQWDPVQDNPKGIVIGPAVSPRNNQHKSHIQQKEDKNIQSHISTPSVTPQHSPTTTTTKALESECMQLSGAFPTLKSSSFDIKLSKATKDDSSGNVETKSSLSSKDDSVIHPLDWSNKSECDGTDSHNSTITDNVPCSEIDLKGKMVCEEVQTHLPFHGLTSTSASGASNTSNDESSTGTSRQFINDLVWLEKRIAQVRSNSPTRDDERATNSMSPIMQSIVCRDCYAPPGKVNLIIQSTKDGPSVLSVPEGSPLVGQLFAGDLIVAVNNRDTRSMTADMVMKMMQTKEESERKITVLHFEDS